MTATRESLEFPHQEVESLNMTATRESLEFPHQEVESLKIPEGMISFYRVDQDEEARADLDLTESSEFGEEDCLEEAPSNIGYSIKARLSRNREEEEVLFEDGSVGSKHRKRRCHGQWKVGLFDFFFSQGRLFSLQICNACFCPHLLLSRLLTRMGMAWLTPGSRKASSNNNKKRTMLLFVLIFAVEVCFMPPLVTVQASTSASPTIEANPTGILWHEVLYWMWSLPLTMYTVRALVRLRRTVRQQHGIQAGCLGSTEDVAVSLCCSCCTLQQLERQTSEDEEEDECYTDDVSRVLKRGFSSDSRATTSTDQTDASSLSNLVV
jgi:Cys-rich protein (TIGR01571 family)